jgi:hypothetical protein
MFTRKDHLCFIAAALILSVACVMVAVDPVENGFGVMTLYIAPPLLLSAFIIPVLGITGVENLRFLFSTPGKINKVKHLLAVVSFLVAFISYLITLEPTASLWDCSEFIASAYKLQVPHTPGTPLSLIFGRLFSMLSLGDVSKIAWSINLMSAFFSALTVSIVYYVVYFFGKSIVLQKGKREKWMLGLASFGGSLCLAFSDTFWFSAVEAETYGIACFFLVLLVWLIVTGKDLEESVKGRRLVLIFYLSGLAYCIHPMCLLALPILPITWYTTARKVTWRNVVVATVAGLLIVLLINRFVAIGFFELAFSFDLFFVNQLHLPFYSGAIIFLLLLVCLVAMLIKKYPSRRRYVWALVFLLAGFAPYLLLFIRSTHNPPIDETNPENLAMIKAYMNRESYPSSPLLFGPYFDARIKDVRVKKQIYFKSTQTYEVAGSLPEYQYDSRQTFLPRLYSNDADHVEAYRQWTGLEAGEKPGFIDNIKFLFTYQLGHMYFRYLMWNFAGRESDIQNSGWLKPWEPLSNPPFENARNQYWMIPLVLGLLGAIYQYRKDKKSFVSVTLFFLITGTILAIYLNSPPIEPRERDYIYVGSYIAFCLWIGMGFLLLGNYLMKIRLGIVIAALLTFGVPLWMFNQNYDDHNRSGRTFQVDNARNILKGCAPNSILFTGGDNDTFPLWYLQEVEGFRTDVRVMVLSYMNTDWYINQLRKTYYDSGAFRLTLGENDYRQYGPNDVLYLQESISTPIDVKQYLQLLKEEHPALRQISRNGEPFHILPSRLLKLRTHKQKSFVPGQKETSSREVENEILFSIEGEYLSKNVLAIMDLIASNEWKRPIHFNFSSMNTLGVDLSDYLVQEGPVYRLVPNRHEGENIKVDTELAYRNLIEAADYSNLQDSTLHLSYEDHYARILVPIRQSFNALAIAYLDEGNAQMAERVLTEAKKKLYHEHLRPSYTNVQAAEILQTIGKNDLADALATQAFDYYLDVVEDDLSRAKEPDRLDVYLLRQSALLLDKKGGQAYLKKVNELRVAD